MGKKRKRPKWLTELHKAQCANWHVLGYSGDSLHHMVAGHFGPCDCAAPVTVQCPAQCVGEVRQTELRGAMVTGQEGTQFAGPATHHVDLESGKRTALAVPRLPENWKPPFCSNDAPGLKCPRCREEAVCVREKECYLDCGDNEAYCAECGAQLSVTSLVTIVFSDVEALDDDEEV
jgi:hypothetical protein